MTTDSERRAVARRLREIADGYEEVSDFDLARTLGLGAVSRYGYDPDDVRRLADLIEPSGHGCVPGECPLNVCHDNDHIDRERLLAIATTMAADSVRAVKQGISVSPVYILQAARNIAEACGETFGSIRNRELAEWGTSIVPKETIVDRDALLELAEEAKKCAWYFGLNHDNEELKDRLEEAAADFSDFARRIREACGEWKERE